MNPITALYLPDETALLALGARLAAVLEPGIVMGLEGDLGAGKTTLVRGLLRKLGYQDIVKSPTYTLVESYSIGGFKLYHWDLYRIKVPEELYYMGQRDFFDGLAVHCMEWPEKGKGCINAVDLTCQLQFEGEGRKMVMIGQTEPGMQMVKRL